MLLYIDHKSQQAPSSYGHEGPVWYPCNVHGHGSVRAVRVRSDILWCKSEYGCSEPNGLDPKDRNDV